MAYSNNRSTFFCPAGTKWYWEFVPTTGYNYAACGITTNSHETTINPGGGNSTPSGHGVGFYGVEVDVDGSRTSPAGNSAWASGDIIGFAYDVDANTIKKYINGSLDFTYSSVPVSTDGDYSPSFGDFGGSVAATINVNFGQDSSFAGTKTSGSAAAQDGNDCGDFYYTPPTGYLALCTNNLPDPSIADPTKHFNTVLWTGSNSSPRTISGVGFQPDFLWIKDRVAANNNVLTDSVRGSSELIYSNSNVAVTGAAQVSSYNSDGFVMGTTTYVNESGSNNTYVGWNWKAGGTAVANTTGDINVNVSANTTNGFSIIKYTGLGDTGGSGETIAHGLSQPPEIVFIKRYDGTADWMVGAGDGPGWTDYNALNYPTQFASSATAFRNTAPTATYITLGGSGGLNGSGSDYVCYAFHSVEGYSKVGSYSGNGSIDGTFIYTGFRPAYALIKCYTGSNTQEWLIVDNKRSPNNEVDKYLYANTNVAEGSAGQIDADFVSNGIKFRSAGGPSNASGRSYIYMAFAESPFKTSNAR